jgi:hypothetical protein
MNGWESDKRWSDKFIPQIKGFLADALISEAPIDDDQERNTDLIVLTMKPFRIGCRVRNYKYIERYGDEFTIRAGRPSGKRTELSKIVEGWGDYFFYGFANEAETSIIKFTLGDLNVFRLWFNQRLFLCDKGCSPGKIMKNFDGSSIFSVFKISELPPGFVISRI